MFPRHTISNKKEALIAYKEKLMKDLNYCDQRLEEIRNNKIKPIYESYDSSDSDCDLPICMPMEARKSPNELKQQQEKLQTCLNAIQELTSLTVRESEICILSEDPPLKDCVLEPGLWRSVRVKCRVDMVPISMSFLVHQPSREFSQPSFHDIRVSPLKTAHEKELHASVLHSAKTPSEAFEVIRNYSLASRSRRTTLAKLDDAFPTTLFMEPMDDGGYKMKCGDIIEICWRLENTASNVAPFQHRFKFELEYLDETYLKSIREEFKQLSYPKLETDERTLLLAKIINICLEARPPEVEDGIASAEVEKVTEAEQSIEVDNARQAKGNKKNHIPENQAQKSKKGEQNSKATKENQDPNSEKVKNSEQKSNDTGKKQKQKKTAEADNVLNEGHVKDKLHKKSDVISEKKLTGVVEDNMAKENTKKIITKKSPVEQDKTEVKTIVVETDKGNENPNEIRKEKDLLTSSKFKQVTSQKDKMTTEVQKEKALKRKADDTNKQIEVKKTKVSSQTTKVDKAIAQKILQAKNTAKDNLTNNIEPNKLVNDDKLKAAVKKITTATNHETVKVDQKDLVKQRESEMPNVGNNPELASGQSENLKTISKSDQLSKNTEKIDINQRTNLQKSVKNLKSIPAKMNKLPGTKISNTKIKDGITAGKISKTQLAEKVNKPDNVTKVGNDKPTIVASTDKVNAGNNVRKERTNANSELNAENETIQKVVERNQVVKNKDRIANVRSATKSVASSENKNPTVVKTLFKDKIISSNLLGKNKLLKRFTTKTNSTNLPLKSTNPGNISKIHSASNVLQNGGMSRIPQKKATPDLRHKMKDQLRKSPRNLITVAKKNERPESNIPRIIKLVRRAH